MRKITALLAIWTMAISIVQAHEISVDQFMGEWKVVAIAGFEDPSDGPPGAKALHETILKISPGGMDINVKEAGYNHWDCAVYSPFVIRKADLKTFVREEINGTVNDLMPPAPYPKLKKQLIMLDNSTCLTVIWMSSQYIEFDFGGILAIAKRLR